MTSPRYKKETVQQLLDITKQQRVQIDDLIRQFRSMSTYQMGPQVGSYPAGGVTGMALPPQPLSSLGGRGGGGGGGYYHHHQHHHWTPSSQHRLWNQQQANQSSHRLQLIREGSQHHKLHKPPVLCITKLVSLPPRLIWSWDHWPLRSASYRMCSTPQVLQNLKVYCSVRNIMCNIRPTVYLYEIWIIRNYLSVSCAMAWIVC